MCESCEHLSFELLNFEVRLVYLFSILLTGRRLVYLWDPILLVR